mmetsp:Transcript_39765/g.74640  ORF Transcript_39765/g.74640 Transcript_39765/m.74640 type:complete len:260 (-) Transcript_39765:113-892(-)
MVNQVRAHNQTCKRPQGKTREEHGEAEAPQRLGAPLRHHRRPARNAYPGGHAEHEAARAHGGQPPHGREQRSGQSRHRPDCNSPGVEQAPSQNIRQHPSQQLGQWVPGKVGRLQERKLGGTPAILRRHRKARQGQHCSIRNTEHVCHRTQGYDQKTLNVGRPNLFIGFFLFCQTCSCTGGQYQSPTSPCSRSQNTMPVRTKMLHTFHVLDHTKLNWRHEWRPASTESTLSLTNACLAAVESRRCCWKKPGSSVLRIFTS